MMLPIVEVLLATYNGAAFLQEQIDSVFAQRDVDVRIVARDDGSTDATSAILQQYVAKNPVRFRVLQNGEPTGSAKGNFSRLLAASTGPHVAFCDQDDVWLPHKLRHTLQRMQQLEAQFGTETPLLVSTDLQVVDEALRPIASSLWRQNGLANATKPPLGQLLSENTVTGCTALLNRALVDRMREMPVAALMHDHWAALIAASTGALAGIDEATMLYRQHNSNVVGAVESRPPLENLRRLLSHDAFEDRALQYRKDRAQAQALIVLHGSTMSSAARATVEAFVALEDMPRIKRIRTMQHYNLWRSGTARKLTALADILR
jgi:glycosyltransferase involved in cell wall biosynthesis